MGEKGHKNASKTLPDDEEFRKKLKLDWERAYKRQEFWKNEESKKKQADNQKRRCLRLKKRAQLAQKEKETNIPNLVTNQVQSDDENHESNKVAANCHAEKPCILKSLAAVPSKQKTRKNKKRISDKALQEERAKARERQRKRRAKLTTEELKKIRQIDNLRRKQRLKRKIIDEELSDEKQKKKRAMLATEKLKKIQQMKRLGRRISDEALQEKRAKARERQRKRRAKLTTEELKKIRQREDLRRKQRLKRKISDEELQERRAKAREKQRKRRAKLSSEK